MFGIKVGWCGVGLGLGGGAGRVVCRELPACTLLISAAAGDLQDEIRGGGGGEVSQDGKRKRKKTYTILKLKET